MTLVPFVRRMFLEGADMVSVDYAGGVPWRARWRIRNRWRSAAIERGVVRRTGVFEMPKGERKMRHDRARGGAAG